MSVQFRHRTTGEYARIIWKRKWLILLPTIAIASSVAWVVMRLPDVYESHTLIVVKPATISPAVVPAMSEETLTRQINAINQVVMSRTSLEPLVVKYRLYETERAHGEPMESVIDGMRQDIKVELDTSRDITNGFKITFRGRDPRTTQAVTGELASKYIDAQTEESAKTGRVTKEFFEQRLAELKEDLDTIAQKRLNFMTQNLSHLPGQAGLLGTQLTGLFEQQKSLITNIGRLSDQQNILSQSLGDLEKQREQEIDNIIEEGNDPKKSPEYLLLKQRESSLEAEVRDMKRQYKPANPDLIKKQDELASVQNKMKAVLEEGRDRAEEKRKRYESQTDPRINQVKYNLENTKSEIARQQKQLDDTNAQIADVRRNINAIPDVQVGLEALDREYNTKQEAYNDLLKKQQNADTVADISSGQQGTSIAVVDAANLPEVPVAPKRMTLIGLGVVLGFFAGLGLAALFEIPRLLTVQTTNDAEHYTGLPVLVAVPELLTPQEARWLPRRRLLLLASGVIATIISIPALAYVLKWTHFFDRFS